LQAAAFFCPSGVETTVSVKDLKEYGKRAAQDPAVRAKAKSIGLQNVTAQAAYAKTLGYHFDQADMNALATDVQLKGQLSDRELSQVAGGVVAVTAPIVVAAAMVSAAVGSGFETNVPGAPTAAATVAGGW
jgi:predicted ribosomally synthesized peptide with nif11-like leader